VGQRQGCLVVHASAIVFGNAANGEPGLMANISAPVFFVARPEQFAPSCQRSRPIRPPASPVLTARAAPDALSLGRRLTETPK